MKTRLTVENGDTLNALQRFLQRLLTEQVVDLLLVPMRTPHGSVTPALVSDPGLLVHADPLAPVMPVNAAALVGQVTVRAPRPKVGAVLRSCEARALVELVKLQQASADDLLLVAVDCPGTLDVPEYIRYVNGNGEGDGLCKELFSAALQRPAELREELRPACQICDQPMYDQAQVVVELFNSNLDQEIVLSLPDELGARLGYSPVEAAGRGSVVEKLVTARAARRDEAFAARHAVPLAVETDDCMWPAAWCAAG